MTDKPKDPMTKFRNVVRGKNSKGGDRFQLYLSTEEAQALVATINSSLTSPKGVKVDLHISKKEYEGRTFDSAIAFVKPVAEMGAYGAGAGGGGARNFVPKTDVAGKIANLNTKTLK